MFHTYAISQKNQGKIKGGKTQRMVKNGELLRFYENRAIILIPILINKKNYFKLIMYIIIHVVYRVLVYTLCTDAGCVKNSKSFKKL